MSTLKATYNDSSNNSVCAQCQKKVRTQTVIKSCSKCNKIFHNKCSRFSMKVVRTDIFCVNCLDTYSIEKY